MRTDAQDRSELLSTERRSPAAKTLVCADPASLRLLAYIEKLAPSEAPVLIMGETGTGKELVAQHIHQVSGRKGPFLAVNCGAISDQLAESELFGHEPGSFTGAVGRREGWFEAADGGTLFLDEVGDLPLTMQVKLLRVLQEREVVRIGSRKPIAVNVRVVAATSVELEHAVSAGRFRRDLFYRLNTALVRLPALRERPGDVLPLAEHFLREHCQRMNRPASTLSITATSVLLAHSWPGNIREMENVIQFALLMSNGTVIEPQHLKVREWPAPMDDGVAVAAQASAHPLEVIAAQLRRAFLNPTDTLYDDLERLIVTETYQYCGNNQVQSAALLGISHNVLRTLLKRHGLLSDSTFAEQRTLDGRWAIQASSGH